MGIKRDYRPGAALCGVLLFFFSQAARALDSSDIIGDTFEETEGSGLLIRTKPAGARVFIDGAERGQTPYLNSAIKPGHYNVRLFKEGYRERRFRVTISDSNRMAVSVELEEVLGQVLINVSRAEGSPPEMPLNPLIDGGQGESGEMILNLPLGLRTVHIRAFGWEEVTETVFVREYLPVTLNVTLKPVPFSMSGGKVSRRSFNPNNPGALGETYFHFTVSGPGAGTLLIQDQSGAEVFSVPAGPFETWSQRISWNGRDNGAAALPAGKYQATISAASLWGDSDAVQKLVLDVQIDYTLAIYPLALVGGIPGLFFTPVPAALPHGSFQVDALYLFGGFSVPDTFGAERNENDFSFIPVEFGFRFPVLSRLELAGAFNVNASNTDSAGFGLSVSLRYAFIGTTESFPLGLAAGLSYTYAQANGQLPLGTGRGFGLYLPMSVDIGRVTVLWSPGMRWPGPEDPVPRLLFSVGALFQGAWFTVGLSAREEFDFTDSGSRSGLSFSQRLRFHGGLELNLYPPPSFLVYTLLGGIWLYNDRIGGFGGLGVGFIY